MAPPPHVPSCQTARIASIFGSKRCKAMGRPAERINTVGLPTAATSSASCSCKPGSPMEDREAFSALIAVDSPRQRRTMSADFASRTAAAKPSRSSLSMSQPLVVSIATPGGSRCRRLSKTLLASAGSPR